MRVMVRKKPEDWLKMEEFKKYKIKDYDGWDRHDFEDSWNKKIGKTEFVARLCRCTLSGMEK